MFTAANKGSYVAQAGQANPFLDAFSVASAYSFDAFDLAKTGMEADASKYITKKENEAKRDYYKTMGETNLAGQKQVNKAADYAAQQQRMAGGLGLLGALSYGTSRYFQNKNNPLPPPEKRQSADNTALIEALDNQSELYTSIQEKLTQLKNDFNSDDSPSPSPTVSPSPSPSPSSSTPTKASLGGGAGWSPLGSTIKFAEGTYRKGDKAYNTGFGYNMFDDLSKHPDKVFNNTSAAAGAYQFMPSTWQGAKSALKLTDFGPQSQERAGEYLTTKRGVQTDKPFTTVQELRAAFDKLAPEWASIPLSSTGKSYYDGDGINSAKPFDELRRFYEQQVGYTLKS